MRKPSCRAPAQHQSPRALEWAPHRGARPGTRAPASSHLRAPPSAPPSLAAASPSTAQARHDEHASGTKDLASSSHKISALSASLTRCSKSLSCTGKPHFSSMHGALTWSNRAQLQEHYSSHILVPLSPSACTAARSAARKGAQTLWCPGSAALSHAWVCAQVCRSSPSAPPAVCGSPATLCLASASGRGLCCYSEHE